MPLRNWTGQLLTAAACASALAAAGCDGGGGSDGFEINQTRSDRASCDAGEQTQCSGVGAPAVVADQRGAEFAVLWDANFTVAERTLYGRRFDAETGDPRSDERVVAARLPYSPSPKTLVVRHPGGDGYLAVAAYHPSQSTRGPWRVLSLGPALDLRSVADLQPSPGGVLSALAANDERREALVVETSFPVEPDAPTGPTSGDHPIRAIRVDGNGRPRGQREIAVSDWEQGFAPIASAAYVPARDEYLVTLLAQQGDVERFDVLRLDDDLGAVRPAPSPAVRGTPVETAIAHSAGARRTLLAWVEWQPDRSRRVVGAWLDEEGTAGARFEIGDDVADGNPDGIGLRAEAVGSDFVVSWTDGLMDGERRHERVTADRPGEADTRISFEKPGPGESTESAVASSPLGTHLAVWTEGLRDRDGRKLRGRLSGF